MDLAYLSVSAWLFLHLSGSCAKEHLAPYAHSGRPLSPQAKQGLLDLPPTIAIGMIGGGGGGGGGGGSFLGLVLGWGFLSLFLSLLFLFLSLLLLLLGALLANLSHMSDKSARLMDLPFCITSTESTHAWISVSLETTQEYYVHWEGYDSTHNNWEPADHFKNEGTERNGDATAFLEAHINKRYGRQAHS